MIDENINISTSTSHIHFYKLTEGDKIITENGVDEIQLIEETICNKYAKITYINTTGINTINASLDQPFESKFGLVCVRPDLSQINNINRLKIGTVFDSQFKKEKIVLTIIIVNEELKMRSIKKIKNSEYYFANGIKIKTY